MSELKERKEKLFSTMKNGYDRISEQDLKRFEEENRIPNDPSISQ